MKELSKNDIEFLVDCLKNGKEIPEIFKYSLFPTKQKEYELVYAAKMRKEDVLADTEEAKPVPLQIEKIFNGKKYPLYSSDWHNLLVFGDNLQVLKTFYEDKDPLIKGKVKGRVKLIYIDPPFATESDFKGDKGEKAYSDKAKGAEFVEFIRRRLIIAKELLSTDGSIFVHLDQKKGHYIKLVLDEVFGESNFRNEIVVRRINKNLTKQFEGIKSLNVFGDSIYVYTRNSMVLFNPPTKTMIADGYWHSFKQPADRPTLRYKLLGVKITDGQWMWKEDRALKAVENYKKYLSKYGNKVDFDDYAKQNLKDEFLRPGQSGMPEYYIRPKIEVICDSLWNEFIAYDYGSEYPTTKSEELLTRIVKMASNEGDLVMDFFVGSGTALTVAEKLGRRWIGCDIGKLAIYTSQKRLLGIDKSKDLSELKKKYAKPAKSFAIITSGLYDLGKVFALQKDEYIRFVKDLFEIEESKQNKIGGINIDGKRREYLVKIFPYWELKNASVDEKYLQELHKHIGGRIEGRFYIIAPANNVNFISDYHQINNVRYYFLKVPYQVIKELHKVQFKKLRQPQSKSQINDLDEAIGFHFIRQPEVKSEIKISKDKVTLKIKKFESAYAQDETGEKLKNFESLAMLLVDLDYDGEKFMMTKYYFAQDLLNHNLINEGDVEKEIKEELKKQKEITKEFSKKECGKQIMAIYVDIYGNEFREIFNLK